MSDGHATPSDPALMPRKIWMQLACVLLALPAVGILLGLAVREPITTSAAWFVGRFDLAGVFVGVLIIDALPFLVDEPVLLLGYSGGLGFWRVGAVGAAASVLAGPVGWFIGKAVGRSPGAQTLFGKYKVDAFMQKHGAKAVAVAAITPFPFALTTWCSGATGVPIGRVLLGSLLRIPKIFLYLWLILLGWNAA